MPEYDMDGSRGENYAKELDEHYVPHKELFNEESPKTPLHRDSPPLSTLSPESDGSLERAIDEIGDISIDQLYHNIYEMESSEHSPSMRSVLSYGEESRIDSELRFLAGGDYGVTEIKREVVAEPNDENTPPEGNTVSKDDDNPANTIKPIVKASQRSRTASPGKPPNGKQIVVKGVKRIRSSPSIKNEKSPQTKLQNGSDDQSGEPGYLGPYLLKQAREMIMSGENSKKALELALRAMKSFESSSTGKPNLDFVMCLHVVAALYCRLVQYTEAVPVLERSIDIPVMDIGQNHALAKFAGCMQLGDTYAMLGQIENSILFYTAGLEIQREILGEKDARLGETCRYLAEAHVQAMQFDEAEKLCLMALDIHKETGSTASPQEAADRRLMGLICDSKGDYETALENYVLASMAMAANNQNADVAAIDCNIGDSYLSLARYDEAVFAYQKALNMLKSSKGENHASVASVFVRLAVLYNKIGKFSESKSFCENALRIYAKPIPGTPLEEIASGLVDISAIYESINEPERALKLLQKALKIYGHAPGQQNIIAGIEAQVGVLYYILGSYSESYKYLKNAIVKFRSIGEKKSAIFGIVLNQMGLACVQLFLINEAADLFEEARSILEAEYGPYHADTLGVYSNLAGTYDAMGRTGDAIELLEYVVEMREEKLGTANPDVEDEKHRLAELLKEAGTVRNRKSRSLKNLLVGNSQCVGTFDIEVS